MAEKRFRAIIRSVTVATLLGGSGLGHRDLHAQASAQSAATSQNPISILFHSDPNPLRVGKNSFEVMVKEGEKAVKDAEVTLVFEAPGSNVSTTKSTIALKYRAAGIYRGSGEVTVPGDWSITIIVKREGREAAIRRLAVVAK